MWVVVISCRNFLCLPFWLKNCLYDYCFNSQGRCPAPLYWSVRARTSLGGIVLEQCWLWAWPWLYVQGHPPSLLSPVGIVLLGCSCDSSQHPWTPTLKQLMILLPSSCCGSSCQTFWLWLLWKWWADFAMGKTLALRLPRSQLVADLLFTCAVMACGGQRLLHHSIFYTATYLR